MPRTSGASRAALGIPLVAGVMAAACNRQGVMATACLLLPIRWMNATRPAIVWVCVRGFTLPWQGMSAIAARLGKKRTDIVEGGKGGGK